MYEEKEHKINWIVLLKRILWYVLVVIVILGLIALITRCARNTKNTKSKTTIDLSNEVLKLQEASLQYFNIDNLPNKEKESRSIKLKYLIAKDYINPLTDSQDNKCDTNESYSEVTKLKNNYYLVTKIKCGKNSKTKKVYIGCFTECNGNICIGKKEDKGICEIKQEPETTTIITTTSTTTIKPTTRNTTRTTTQTSTLRTVKRTTTTVTTKKTTRKTTATTSTTRRTTTTTKPTTTTKKPTTTTKKPTTTTTKPTTTTKKPTTTTTKPTTQSSKPTTQPTQPKCYKHVKCTSGSLTDNNSTCLFKKDTNKTQEGDPITISSGTYSTPAACLNAPSGKIFECILDHVDWSSLEPFIYIKTVYTLCPYSGYSYDTTLNKCTKKDSNYIAVIYTHNNSESGYVNTGAVSNSKCN